LSTGFFRKFSFLITPRASGARKGFIVGFVARWQRATNPTIKPLRADMNKQMTLEMPYLKLIR
jgi:hypothetical protein